MKSVGEIMEELGFNKDAPVETQKAFIKHLMRKAYGAPVQNLPEKQIGQQLELNIEAPVAEQIKKPGA